MGSQLLRRDPMKCLDPQPYLEPPTATAKENKVHITATDQENDGGLAGGEERESIYGSCPNQNYFIGTCSYLYFYIFSPLLSEGHSYV